MSVNLKVIDCSHHNPIDDDGFQKMFDFGIRGIIHKATQGVGYKDPQYDDRRQPAIDAGMKWGSYCFNTGEDVHTMVDRFLAYAKPEADTVCVIDFEDNAASQMSLDHLVEFLKYGDQQLGRPFWIYSGNRIKHIIPNADDDTKAFLATHPLWGCEYGPRWKNVDENGDDLPWDKVTLWQFSGDGVNAQGIHVPGIHGAIDMNSFDGTDDELASIWK